MKGPEAQFAGGVANDGRQNVAKGEQTDNAIKKKNEANPREILLNRVENDAINQKLLEYLEAQNIVSYDGNGNILLNMDLIQDPKFKQKLSKYYIGRSNDKLVKGSIKKISKLFEGVNVINGSNNKIGYFDDMYEGKIYLHKNPKEKLLDILEQDGVFEKKEGYNVVDIEKFTSKEFWSSVENKTIPGPEKKRRNVRKLTPKLLFNFLENFECVSKEEYEYAKKQGVEIKLKPLFNTPDDIRTVTDAEYIKSKKYHLNFWDIDKKLTWSSFDVQTESGEVVRAEELYLATKIFKDLKGKRDNQGNLVIFDKHENDFVKMSFEKLNANGVKLLQAKHNIKTSQFLSEYCPHMLDSGLIKFEDFDLQTKGGGDKLLRKEKTFSNPNVACSASFDSVQYYIGKGNFKFEDAKIPMEEIKVVQLDNENGGIIRMNNGEERLLYTFSFLNEDERTQLREKVKQKNPSLTEKQVTQRSKVGKKAMDNRIEHYALSRFVPKGKDETAEQYADRLVNLSYLADYKYVQGVTKKLSIKSGVGIHKLNWREQIQIARMYHESEAIMKEGRFVEFAKTHRLQGLRTFLSIEQGGPEMGEKILTIAETLKDNPEIADMLFAQYAKMSDEAESRVDEMVQMYQNIFYKKNIDRDLLLNQLLLRSNQILIDASDKLTQENNEEVIKEIIEDLKREERINAKVLEDVKNVYNNLYTQKEVL